MKITYLGHGALHIIWGDTHLVCDPFISGNPLARHINIKDIKADYMLITHGHEDHVLDAEEIAKHNDATLISSFEIISWFGKKGLKGHPMNLGGKYSFDFGTVKYVNAIHSSVLPDGTYGGNPGGFVIWDQESCIYIAGDTALSEDMKLIPKTCPRLDLAILPIGDNFTMGYEDAVIASDYIDCNRIMGYHFDTFPPITIDKAKARALFTEHNKELIIPEIGETISLK
ncbi:MAG: metal-dependent hydrolase [Bacteroidota bacterium]